jgi:ATP-dependent DNA helicase RecQ
MRKQAAVRLVPLAGEDGPDPAVWERVDRELFEALAELRDRLAEEGQVAPRVVLGDWVLRELARVRPSSLERMRLVSGVSDAKLNAHGAQLLEIILTHCRARGVPLDQPAGPPRSSAPTVRKTAKAVEQHERAVALYRGGATVDAVMAALEVGRATAVDHLCDFIRQTRPLSIDRWVSVDVQQRVAAAARQAGTERLKPIYLLLGEKIPYEDIRVVVSHLLSVPGGS